MREVLATMDLSFGRNPYELGTATSPLEVSVVLSEGEASTTARRV
jgi:hypothetical protein